LLALPAAAAEVSRSVIFTIRIPAILRVKALAPPPRLTVTAEDVARGMLELDEATIVSLQNNCRSGVTVSAALGEGDFARVEIRLAAGDPLADAAHLGFWGTEPREVRVGYRLYLKPGAAAGVRAWPVALRFANCA
jgi:hypothetical protein